MASTPRRVGTALALSLLVLPACGSELEGRAPDAASGDTAAEVETAEPEVLEETAEDGEAEIETDAPDDVAETTAETSEDSAGEETDVADTSDEDVEIGPIGPCDGLADGSPCDDGDLCTSNDRCVGGLCLPEEAISCDDDNVCTDDTCLPTEGCVHLPNLAACEDGDPCTSDDRCSVGICRPGGPACDDRNPCTADSCAPSGECANIPDDSLSCSDASECTTGDFCAGGVCISGLGDGCAEDDPCIEVACGADGLTCELSLLDGAPCDDEDACTVDDACQGGLCRPGEDLVCPWDSECAAFSCDRQLGCQLETVFQEGKACSDDDRCTLGETCNSEGACAPVEGAECDDDNPCTEDTCDARWGCQHSWIDAECDDGSRCTTDDMCRFGRCQGTAVVCDDGDACTSDSCDPLLGCQALATRCDDGNPCTRDGCDPETGCTFTPTDGACDDNLACTVMERCVEGECKAEITTCGDDDPCTVDVCDAEEGCVNVPLDPCPIDALTIEEVGITGDPDGLGQWVAITNSSEVTFDLEGYAIHGDACDCEALIDDGAVVEPGETVYGLRASSPSPLPSELAPGGPASASAFDFEFGEPGDGFFIDAAADRIELVTPGGDLVDELEVMP